MSITLVNVSAAVELAVKLNNPSGWLDAGATVAVVISDVGPEVTELTASADGGVNTASANARAEKILRNFFIFFSFQFLPMNE